MKTLIFFRTHYIDPNIINEYRKLETSLKKDEELVLFIDNHKNILKLPGSTFPVNYVNYKGFVTKSLIFDENLHRHMGLPYYTDDSNNTELAKVMWYNSDFPFYIIRKFFPDYDFYWSIENDVYCNGNSYRIFLDKYQNDNDMIISNYTELAKDSEFILKESSNWAYEGITKYRGLFPVIRLSGRAIDHLYRKRLEYAQFFEQIKHDPKNTWLHCELFVPTELTNNNFKCQGLDTEKLRYLPVYNLSKKRIFEHRDFLLYHPVK